MEIVKTFLLYFFITFIVYYILNFSISEIYIRYYLKNDSFTNKSDSNNLLSKESLKIFQKVLYYMLLYVLIISIAMASFLTFLIIAMKGTK